MPPGTSLDEHIDVLHRESGASLTRKLPTLKLYKIGVKLDMTGQTAADAKTEVLEHERPERKAEMPAPDLSELELAVIRIVQEDLPNVEHPFAEQGAQIGSRRVNGDRHDSRVEGAQADAAVRGGDEPSQRRLQGQRHGRVGGSRRSALEASAPQMATFSAVSHCYRRPTYDDWPYSVFTMVHGRSAATAKPRSKRSATRPA